jgi:hypothetical protein
MRLLACSATVANRRGEERLGLRRAASATWRALTRFNQCQCDIGVGSRPGDSHELSRLRVTSDISTRLRRSGRDHQRCDAQLMAAFTSFFHAGHPQVSAARTAKGQIPPHGAKTTVTSDPGRQTGATHFQQAVVDVGGFGTSFRRRRTRRCGPRVGRSAKPCAAGNGVHQAEWSVRL